MASKMCLDGLVHFRGFRFDPETHELYRNGREIRIRGHPAQILVELLEHPEQVVTREALRKSLWPDHTFVDFEHVLNNSINHLREALGDDAAAPRFIQTVPGLGYRFIARLEGPAHRKRASPQDSATESRRTINPRPKGETSESEPHDRRQTRWPRFREMVDRLFVMTGLKSVCFRRVRFLHQK